MILAAAHVLGAVSRSGDDDVLELLSDGREDARLARADERQDRGANADAHEHRAGAHREAVERDAPVADEDHSGFPFSW